jgi:hypothetical protein
MKYMTNLVAALALASVLGSCNDEIEMRRPPKFELPELPTINDIHTFKAPLYWSVYEYCYELERAGVENSDMDITPDEWDKIIDWMATDLKPYGYDMVCTDGFIPMLAKDASGYMTHYGSMSLKDLVAKCNDNPLWIHGDNRILVPGTDYTFGSLRYNGSEEVVNPKNDDMWFSWVVVTHPGAKEYIDGFFKHYHDLGIDYIRMDFMSWYEDGKDRNMGIVGRGYGRDLYARAMSYIAEAAKKYDIFTSVVMPHLYDDAILEAKYGNMVRIVADTAGGGWWHCSAQDKGKSYANWPNCMNMFDGFTYWSHIAGRDKVILDGDFIRLNKFSTNAEKEFVISLQLMAGGPVTVADQYHNIGKNLKFYTNPEMLALNADRFVGKPLSDNLNDANNQIWYGQMSNGDYIIGIFNRDDNSKSVEVKFADLGINGTYNVRDLWKHTDEGAATSLTAKISARGCKIVKLTK